MILISIWSLKPALPDDVVFMSSKSLKYWSLTPLSNASLTLTSTVGLSRMGEQGLWDLLLMAVRLSWYYEDTFVASTALTVLGLAVNNTPLLMMEIRTRSFFADPSTGSNQSGKDQYRHTHTHTRTLPLLLSPNPYSYCRVVLVRVVLSCGLDWQMTLKKTTDD